MNPHIAAAKMPSAASATAQLSGTNHFQFRSNQSFGRRVVGGGEVCMAAVAVARHGVPGADPECLQVTLRTSWRKVMDAQSSEPARMPRAMRNGPRCGFGSKTAVFTTTVWPQTSPNLCWSGPFAMEA